MFEQHLSGEEKVLLGLKMNISFEGACMSAERQTGFLKAYFISTAEQIGAVWTAQSPVN